MNSPSSSKPPTFAAMLVRAQRRFQALGRPFPSQLVQQARRVLPPLTAVQPAGLARGAA